MTKVTAESVFTTSTLCGCAFRFTVWYTSRTRSSAAALELDELDDDDDDDEEEEEEDDDDDDDDEALVVVAPPPPAARLVLVLTGSTRNKSTSEEEAKGDLSFGVIFASALRIARRSSLRSALRSALHASRSLALRARSLCAFSRTFPRAPIRLVVDPSSPGRFPLGGVCCRVRDDCV